MSLIALADRTRVRPRTFARTALVLVVLTGAIILGLLAMHTLNGVGHDTNVSATAHAHAEASAPASTIDVAGCAACAEHSGPMSMAMACVLALLALGLVLRRPRMTRSSREGLLRVIGVLPRELHVVAPAPSLDRLCISRT